MTGEIGCCNTGKTAQKETDSVNVDDSLLTLNVPYRIASKAKLHGQKSAHSF